VPEARGVKRESVKVHAGELTGLTARDVELRQQQYGLNLLPVPRGLPIWRHVFAQLVHFFAVMLQMANAFACRSASIWPGKLGWFSNRYLVLAIACEAAILTGFLFIAPLAALLGQAPPNVGGFLVALLAVPAVLAADAIQKRYKRRVRQAE